MKDPTEAGKRPAGTTDEEFKRWRDLLLHPEMKVGFEQKKKPTKKPKPTPLERFITWLRLK